MAWAFFPKYQVGKQKSSFIDWTWTQKTKFIGKSSKIFFIKIKTFPLTQTCALFVNSSFKAVSTRQFLKTQVIRCIQLFEKVKKLTEKYYRQILKIFKSWTMKAYNEWEMKTRGFIVRENTEAWWSDSILQQELLSLNKTDGRLDDWIDFLIFNTSHTDF